MAGADYATRRNMRTRTVIEDDITGTTKNTPQRQHAQSQDKRNTRVLWTRCNCHGQPSRTNRNEVYYYQRSTFIQDLAGLVQHHRNMAGPTGIYVFFHVLGGGWQSHTSQLHPD
jgi:hypothetical protein